MWDAFLHFEQDLLLLIQSVRQPWLSAGMALLSLIGEFGAVWIAMCLALFCFKKTRKAAMLAALSLLVCFLLNNLLLKNLVDRTRPFVRIADLTVLGVIPPDTSFPSGHACSSFAAAHSLFLTRKVRYGWLLYVLAGLIAVSRLYVGVHYLTDVLGGVAVGLLGSTLVTQTLRRRVRFFADA